MFLEIRNAVFSLHALLVYIGWGFHFRRYFFLDEYLRVAAQIASILFEVFVASVATHVGFKFLRGHAMRFGFVVGIIYNVLGAFRALKKESIRERQHTCGGVILHKFLNSLRMSK